MFLHYPLVHLFEEFRFQLPYIIRHTPSNFLNKVNIILSESASLLVVSDSLWPHWLQFTRLLCPWSSPGKNTGVGRHSLLQGIFLIQGSNLCLLHCRQILYHLSHQGSPKKTGLGSHSLLQGSFQPRDQTRISSITGILYCLSHQGSPFIYYILI